MGSGRRRITLRSLVFVALVLAVFAAGLGATAWYGRGGYFVGAGGAGREEIVIFKGRPGGLLWFKPTVAERTAISLSEVLPNRADDIQAGKEYSSIGSARRYVQNITEEAAATTTTSVPFPPGPATSTVTTGSAQAPQHQPQP